MTYLTTLAVLVLAGVAMADSMEIKSDSYEAKCDPSSGNFTLLRDGKAFVTAGRLAGGGGVGSTGDIEDRVLGKGKYIEVVHQDGRADRIMLFPGAPFVYLGSTLKNGAAEAVTVNHVGYAEFDLDIGRPGNEIKWLGTGGLKSGGEGSYMWLVAADPATRRGVVGGWITTDRASGVVFGKTAGQTAQMEARAEHGRLRLEPGRITRLDTFAIGVFHDARLGMEAWADVVAKVYNIKLPPEPVGYCTWYHAGAWTEKALAQQAVFAGKNLKPYGISVLQIDDGWQDGEKTNGPRKNFTRIREGGPYGSGMKATADAIKSAGLTPGIWFMPFSGTPTDPWFKDKADMFVRHDDGTPHESPWGGTCLDMTSPTAQAYLKGEVHQIVHDWGYQYLKMDGLCSGLGVRHVYVNDGYKDDGFGDAKLADPSKTNVQAFRDGLKLIRETAGPGVYILGCTVAQNMRSYGAAIGLVDAMHVGPDNHAAWDAIPTGPRYGTRNYHLNGRIWHNDPDCIYARPSVPLAQAQLLATWVTISGQLSLSSEDFSKLPAERLDMLRRTMPAHGLQARPADLFDAELPRIWVINDVGLNPARHVVGLYNWGDNETTFEYPLEKLGIDPGQTYVAFDYWGNRLIAPFKEKLSIKVPGRSCFDLAIRPLADRPVVVSTSRHITQGLVDLANEKWALATRELSATSQIVEGDPYEVRIALPTGNWTKAVPSTGTAAIEGRLLRIKLPADKGGEVRWTVKFSD